MGRLLAFLMLLTMPGWAQAQVAAEQRIALVVGNAAYKAAPLRNPLNDSRAMAGALRELGFTVIAVENGNRKALQQALRQFREKLGENAVGLFYYSGHGMQVRGVNYLIPVDAEIRSEAEVEEEAVSLNALLARLDEARNRLNIVILDACRDNPFERSFRSGARGLGQVDAPAGTLIAYATAPGRTASDGDGTNGLYTSALLQAMRTPGLQVEEVFKRVRAEVQSGSKRQQVPWEASSLTGNFVFRQGVGTTAVAVPVPLPPMPAVSAAPRAAMASPRFDGRWVGKYQCGQSRNRDDAFERTLRLVVQDGRAQFGRQGNNPDEPGSWWAGVAFADDGTVVVSGDGISGGNKPGQPMQIELKGRADSGTVSASGKHGNRQCTLELRQGP